MNKRPFEQAVLKVESLSDSLFTKKLTLEILTKRPEETEALYRFATACALFLDGGHRLTAVKFGGLSDDPRKLLKPASAEILPEDQFRCCRCGIITHISGRALGYTPGDTQTCHLCAKPPQKGPAGDHSKDRFKCVGCDADLPWFFEDPDNRGFCRCCSHIVK
jgi:hypothetical protein